MFSLASLLVMGPGTVYRLYPILGGPAGATDTIHIKPLRSTKVFLFIFLNDTRSFVLYCIRDLMSEREEFNAPPVSLLIVLEVDFNFVT